MSKSMLQCEPHRRAIVAVAAVMAASIAGPAGAQTDLSSVPLPTYASTASVDVKPNVLFTLDDSGSMNWPYLPDWANTTPPNYTSLPPYLSRNAAFNGIAYDPAITYLPPVTFSASGARDTSAYPSMTGESAATGAGSGTKPNWTAVKEDGFGVQYTGTSNLEGDAYFWTTVPGEYCNSPALTDCIASAQPSGRYAYPAPLRWCDSASLANCRALQDSSFNIPRIAAPRAATLDFSYASGAVVTGIRIANLQVMAGATSASNTISDLASRVATAINACTLSLTGNCTTVGFQAIARGGKLTLLAPGPTSAMPEVTRSSGTVGVSVSPFAPSPIPLAPWRKTASDSAVPGETLFTTLTPDITSYPYPGQATKASTRTDCAGSTCTYAQEMTNYANWYSYYRTRLQLMKTATSRAFAELDTEADLVAGRSRFRVGYMSINNNTRSDFVNLAEFNAGQKLTWFSKLFAAKPYNATPLRRALSQAGRLYAGRLNGTTLNGVTVTDPMQYSCQRNFTILSTDGYWNGDVGTKLDGSTAVGNQDGLLPRPYHDGGSAQLQTRTSVLQRRINTQYGERGTLQRRVLQLQRRGSTLQQLESRLQKQEQLLHRRTATRAETRTSHNNGNTWTAWSEISPGNCNPVGSGSNRRECRPLAWGAAVPVGSCTADWRTGCEYIDGPWENASACAPVNKSSGSGVARACRYLDGAWTATASCTVQPKPALNTTSTVAVARDCRYVDGSWTDAPSCSAVNKSVGSPMTVGIATACQTRVAQEWSNAPACTPSPFNGAGAATECRYNFASGMVPAPSCAAPPPGDFSQPVVHRNCMLQTGTWRTVSPCVSDNDFNAAGERAECSYMPWSSWANVASCSPQPPSTGPQLTVALARECQGVATHGTADSLADVAAYYYQTDLRSPDATGPDATGTCDGPTIAPSTTANDLCADNVPVLGRNVNSRQHMVTHGLALGAQGRMLYSPYQNDPQGQRVYVPDYWAQRSGDFHAVANGSPASPSTGICPWQASGACTWPTPSGDSPANIDDLWHAAVNGRGTYFSAQDPASLGEALRSVLGEITRAPRPGSVAAAATSNPNVTTTDNYVFSSSYLSLDWFGELVMQRIGTDGRLGSREWSARQLLDCASTPWKPQHSYAAGAVFSAAGRCWRVDTGYTSPEAFGAGDYPNVVRLSGLPASRRIYTAGSGNTLVPFTWDQLDATQQALFKMPAISPQAGGAGLSQFCTTGAQCLSDADKQAAQGAALVDFLRGDRSREGDYFRTRRHVLGDIVSSEARYVRTPSQNYADAGFTEFKSAMASRAPTVYLGANDGMLHAFDAETGTERWAFIPPAVLPALYRLADIDYASRHRYFVDGTPEVGDICPHEHGGRCTAAQWKTLLVGGLNQGGRAFHALDVTEPANPRFLWQFTHAQLGYSYSNPRITKLKSGRWVVVVASGYGVPDGVGRVFVLDAGTGALLRTLSTGTGTPTAEAGLARITARAPTVSTNNTVEAVYGGDLLGNVWRFDVNGEGGDGAGDVHLLVQLRDANGKAQPVTARPTVTTIEGHPVVIVGTGRYLGLSDLETTGAQALYAIKDSSGTRALPDPRSNDSKFVQQVLTAGTCPPDTPIGVCLPGQSVRTATRKPVDWGAHDGWYLDFPEAGERAVTDASLAMGTLALTTLVPQAASSAPDGAAACSAQGQPNAKSYLYFLDYLTGGAIDGGNGVAGLFIGDGVATRVSVFRNSDGSLRGITRIAGQGGDGVDASPATVDATTGIRSCEGGCVGDDGNGVQENELLRRLGSGGPPSRRSWRILNGEDR